ncbi:MAG: sulfatase-like hydrolase/transferase [Trueperaceae bacterium]
MNAPGEEQTNIVFILADQLRPDFLSCYGAQFIETPHIDALAKDGVLYSRAISPSPICVPARAALLSGRNAIEDGVMTNRYWHRPDLEQLGIRTWPARLSEQGYHTEAIGKMHFYPWDSRQGFDHRVIAEDKRHIGIEDDYAEYLWRQGFRKYHGNEHEGYFENKGAVVSLIPAEHYVDNWVSDRTCDFLEDAPASTPFALMVGLPSPHCPYDPPAGYADRFSPNDMPPSISPTELSGSFKEEFVRHKLKPWNQVDYGTFSEAQKRTVRAHYAGLVKLLDDAVGRIVQSLERTGQLERTWIIVSSDHGDLLGDFDLIGKQLFYESSIRVPLIVRTPHRPSRNRVDTTVSLTDVTATMLTAAGVEPGPAVTDSVPLPGLGLAAEGEPREFVFGSTNLGCMVTDDRWKLCRYQNGRVGLFDIVKDPQEQTNLAYSNAFLAVQKCLEAVLFDQILSSITVSNRDKFVEAATPLGEGAFGKRGWRRPYPAKV